MNRYTVDELREEAEAYLEYRRSEHPETTVRTDQNKIKKQRDRALPGDRRSPRTETQ